MSLNLEPTEPLGRPGRRPSCQSRQAGRVNLRIASVSYPILARLAAHSLAGNVGPLTGAATGSDAGGQKTDRQTA